MNVPSPIKTMAKPALPLGELCTNLWRYREYLKQSVARDLRKKYKRSHLGYLWSMLNPLCMMIILTVVFSKLFRFQVEHYSVFLFSAILPWQYFSGSVTGSLNSVRANKKIIEHFPVPPYIFALSLAFSNLVNLALAIVPLLGVMLTVGKPISPTMLLLPVGIIPLIMVTLGTALCFSASNIFFDDTQHLVGILLQALYYLSPILYGREHLSQNMLTFFSLNPMFPIIEVIRSLIYVGQIPSVPLLAHAYLSGFLVLWFGLWAFRKASKRFMYFI
jgi:ABC-type polysaccharide/polyol phosphate export permease